MQVMKSALREIVAASSVPMREDVQKILDDPLVPEKAIVVMSETNLALLTDDDGNLLTFAGQS